MPAWADVFCVLRKACPAKLQEVRTLPIQLQQRATDPDQRTAPDQRFREVFVEMSSAAMARVWPPVVKTPRDLTFVWFGGCLEGAPNPAGLYARVFDEVFGASAPMARLFEAAGGLTEVSLAQNELRDAEVLLSRGVAEWAEGNT